MRVIQNLEVKDIAQVARVSKKINEVTNQESLWKNVLLRQLSKFFLVIWIGNINPLRTGQK